MNNMNGEWQMSDEDGKNSRILDLVEEHERRRESGINLIASENWLSGRVKKTLGSDLAGRYHTEWYGGTDIAREIIRKTENYAKRLFKCKHALLAPISGNICDLAAILAYTEPGDAVAMLPFTCGGYPLGIEKFHRRRLDVPANADTYEIDVPRAVELVIGENARLVILGSSFISFPFPVREISEGLADRGWDGHVFFDGSHVLGLIACGEFQDPLREGAEVLFGSTHKSLYGPQGGIMLTDSARHAEKLLNFLEIDLTTGIGLVDNVHMNRIAALGVAFEELLSDGDYGKRVIENARALAGALHRLGVPVRFRERGFTSSHQILLGLHPDDARELCGALEDVGIFIDVAARFGTAEVTHRGMGTPEMEEIAGLVADVLGNGPSERVGSGVASLARKWMVKDRP